MSLSEANGFGFERRWVSLALRAIPEHPDIFAPARREEALDYFGIGTKKVEALGFWMRATGLATMHKPSNLLSLTPLGQAVLTYDPSCDEDGTWWFMHTHLSRKGKKEPGSKTNETWYWYIHDFLSPRFSKADLKNSLSQSYQNSSPATLDSAVNEVFQAMISTPLGSLGLMVETDEKGLYRRLPPGTRRLHPAAVGYTTLVWALGRGRSGETVHLDELATQPEGPGRIYGIGFQALEEYLNQLTSRYDKGAFSYNATAGLNSLTLHLTDPTQIAQAYYEEVVNCLSPREALDRSGHV